MGRVRHRPRSLLQKISVFGVVISEQRQVKLHQQSEIADKVSSLP